MSNSSKRMKPHGNGRDHPITTARAREITPPVNPAEALRRQLHLALIGSFTDDDMGDLAGKLKALALSGDMKAMQLIVQLVTAGGSAAAGSTVNVQQAMVVNQQQNDSLDRRLLVQIIAQDGPMKPAELAEQSSLSPVRVHELIDGHPWFNHESDGWHLTAEGEGEMRKMKEEKE